MRMAMCGYFKDRCIRCLGVKGGWRKCIGSSVVAGWSLDEEAGKAVGEGMKTKYFHRGDMVQTSFGVGEIVSTKIGVERLVVRIGKTRVVVDPRCVTIVRLGAGT